MALVVKEKSTAIESKFMAYYIDHILCKIKADAKSKLCSYIFFLPKARLCGRRQNKTSLFPAICAQNYPRW